jgi:hypothetical protein
MTIQSNAEQWEEGTFKTFAQLRLEAAEEGNCTCGARTAIPHNPWCRKMRAGWKK